MNIYITLTILTILTVLIIWAVSRNKDRDPAKQLEKLKQAAGSGDVYAQFMLAEHLRENSPECAARWYRLAAKQDHIRAQFILGRLLIEGVHVPQDPEEGLAWIKKAAGQDYPEAGEYLQQLQPASESTEPPQADTQAIDTIRSNALEGDHRAQYELGAMYYHGINVHTDHSEAIRWFSMAAEQEDADAQYNLGIMYGRGEGTPKDINRSMSWFMRASENGHSEAAEILTKLSGGQD